MEENRTYQIKVRGRMDTSEMSAGPVPATKMQAGPKTTLLWVQCDQSGLIGLLRHMHARGVLLQSVRMNSNDRHQEES